MTKSGKHCGKRRNVSFWAIFSFVTMFSKSCLLQRRQKASIWGKGLNMSVQKYENLYKWMYMYNYWIELKTFWQKENNEQFFSSTFEKTRAIVMTLVPSGVVVRWRRRRQRGRPVKVFCSAQLFFCFLWVERLCRKRCSCSLVHLF